MYSASECYEESSWWCICVRISGGSSAQPPWWLTGSSVDAVSTINSSRGKKCLFINFIISVGDYLWLGSRYLPFSFTSSGIHKQAKTDSGVFYLISRKNKFKKPTSFYFLLGLDHCRNSRYDLLIRLKYNCGSAVLLLFIWGILIDNETQHSPSSAVYVDEDVADLKAARKYLAKNPYFASHLLILTSKNIKDGHKKFSMNLLIKMCGECYCQNYQIVIVPFKA